VYLQENSTAVEVYCPLWWCSISRRFPSCYLCFQGRLLRRRHLLRQYFYRLRMRSASFGWNDRLIFPWSRVYGCGISSIYSSFRPRIGSLCPLPASSSKNTLWICSLRGLFLSYMRFCSILLAILCILASLRYTLRGSWSSLDLKQAARLGMKRFDYDRFHFDVKPI